LSRVAYELIILVRIGTRINYFNVLRERKRGRERERERERKRERGREGADLDGDFYDTKRAFGALQWCVQHKRKLPRKGLVFPSGAAI